jgi:hypothetical protein
MLEISCSLPDDAKEAGRSLHGHTHGWRGVRQVIFPIAQNAVPRPLHAVGSHAARPIQKRLRALQGQRRLRGDWMTVSVSLKVVLPP